MGGAFSRIVALLVIAFVAIGAQCVASCSLESILQPPCHKMAKRSCAHEQAGGENLKIVKPELAQVAIIPAADAPLPLEPPLGAPVRAQGSPPSHDSVFSTVLRI